MKEVDSILQMLFVDDITLIKVVEALCGGDAVKIIEALKESKELTDEEIVNKTGIDLNSVRRILYKLYSRSLVAVRKSRDEQTGWRIYHWRLQLDQFEGFILSQKRRVLERLQMRLDYEKSHEFYHCSTPGCRKVIFEEAVELAFKCPICNKLLMIYDNKKIVDFLSRKVERLRKELSG